MHCFYINLDSAAARRASIEASFGRIKASGWTLERFPALTAQHVEGLGVPGALRPAEKACLLSHRAALARSLDVDGHAFILEDDTVFSDKTAAVLELLLAQAAPSWDIFFTDIAVGSIAGMIDLLLLKQRISRPGVMKVLNLRELPFFGSSAYVVNQRSKRKLLAALDAITSFDVAYDLVLRQLVNQGHLVAHLVFPFLTTVGDHADSSAIQLKTGQQADFISNLFRKLIWIDGGAALVREPIAGLAAALGDDSKAFGTLCAAMADASLQRE